MTAKPKVLIVDDEERFRTTMAKLLTVNGLEVTAVGSGKAALEELSSKPYDVITLDIRMPGMSGLEALAEIKKVNPGIEVIILTGHGSEKDEAAARRLGAFDHLQKPVDIGDLVRVMEQAVREKPEALQ